MATAKLSVELRDQVGTGKSNALRKKGYIPGVLYGRNKETKNIALKTQELQKLVQDKGYGALVNIELGEENVPAILKDVQKKITKDQYLHVDFQELSENEEVKLTIPIYLENREMAEDISTIVQQQLMEIDIQCLPKNLINHVTVDALRLKDNDVITVGDLDLGEVEILNEDEEVIASLTYAQMEEDDDEESDTPIYMSEKSILR